MHRLFISCLPLVLILLISACSNDDEVSSSHTFRVFTESGVTIAETSGGPKYEGELFRYEEIGRLIQDPEQEESLLFSPTYVMVDEQGYFFVSDIRDKRIVVFGPDFRYSHSIGREGRGPGEFMYPLPLWVREGKIAVAAGSPGPSYIFSTSGDLLEVLTDHRLLMNDYIIPTLGSRYLIRGIDIEFRSDKGFDYQNYRVTCLTFDGDTLSVAETGWIATTRYETDGVSGTPVIANMYFAPKPQLVASPFHGIYCTTGADPEINRYSLEGNRETVYRINLNTTPVTAADRDTALASLRRRVRDEEDPNRRIRYQQSLEHAWFPSVKAFWHEMRVDESGFIWLRLPHGQVFQIPSDPRFHWLVLSPDGEYLGNTRWPAVQPYAGYLSRGYFIGYREDEESGDRHCVIYRIIPAVEGLHYPNLVGRHPAVTR